MESDHFRFKTTPYKHQKAAFDASCRSKYFAYLPDLGTGKTKITLDVSAYMFDNGWVNALMIFGNNGSYTNWVPGVEDHLPDHIQRSVGVWSSKNNRKEMEAMNAAIYKEGVVLRIFLMNIEALAFPRGFKAALDFTKRFKTMAIIDESTTIANHNAARTKAAMQIRDAAKARRILTGSVMDNRPLDAWSQFQFLANGALGYTSYYAFRAQYANLEDIRVKNVRAGGLRTVKVVTGYKNLEELKESIAKISFIVKKEDCLDLPSKTEMNYFVDMTDEQLRMYNQLCKKSIAEIDTESMTYATVKIALTKMLRLHQIVCGHIKDDEGVFHEVPSKRLEALDSILEEMSGRVVIWAHFTYDITKIYEHLIKKYGAGSTLKYHGETTNEEREYVKQVFKRGGEVDGLRFLVANDKTGGYGNNFTAITTAVYYSYDFDNNIHHQTRDRIHRIGQTEPVTYVYMIGRNTIDERIIDVLKGKMSLADLLTPSNWRRVFSN